MKFLDAIFFFIILSVLLWSIKADLFFIIFATVILLYIIIQLFFMDPIDIILSLANFLFLNPSGFFFLIIPFIIASFQYFIKKIIMKRKKKVLISFYSI
jgi:hypothetical protein